MKKFISGLVVFTLIAALANVDRTVVLANSEVGEESTTLSVCEFSEMEVLLSYAREDAVWPELSDAPKILKSEIPTGTYKIAAHSYDDHSTANDPTQANEIWQFWAYGDSSTPTYYSPYTDDLADNEDYNYTVLEESIAITTPIRAIRYVHRAFSSGLEDLQFGGARYDDLTPEQKSLVTWQSVTPVCIDFIPIEGEGSECVEHEDFEENELNDEVDYDQIEEDLEDCEATPPTNGGNTQGTTTTTQTAPQTERLGALGTSTIVSSGK